MILSGSGGKVTHNAFASILYQNTDPARPVAYANTQLVLYANPNVSANTLQKALVYVKGLQGIPAKTRLHLLAWISMALDPHSRESLGYDGEIKAQQQQAGAVTGGWWTIVLLAVVALIAVTFGALFLVYGVPNTNPTQAIVTLPPTTTTTTTLTPTTTTTPPTTTTLTTVTTTTTTPPTTTTTAVPTTTGKNEKEKTMR